VRGCSPSSNRVPRYGYQLKTEFESVTGGVWTLNVGQVYTTLDRLARDGLVEMTDDDGQKSYVLTPAGREELGAWWQAVPVDEPPPRDELMLKVLMAIEKGPDHAIEVITRQRTALFQLLQLHRRNGRSAATADTADTADGRRCDVARRSARHRRPRRARRGRSPMARPVRVTTERIPEGPAHDHRQHEPAIERPGRRVPQTSSRRSVPASPRSAPSTVSASP
jgi:DNA-binding PadR family transcriptional regulator